MPIQINIYNEAEISIAEVLLHENLHFCQSDGARVYVAFIIVRYNTNKPGFTHSWKTCALANYFWSIKNFYIYKTLRINIFLMSIFLWSRISFILIKNYNVLFCVTLFHLSHFWMNAVSLINRLIKLSAEIAILVLVFLDLLMHIK